ncbi:Casein kinase i family protein [Heracleum sosnowskyi]|uniref:histidine kinase n=1 Tax=Heracleum sosnowskyi TaxID=360622 RepID=A0AAD8HPP6_9APIA|nr:Casein kinase i family protein [Heracleum sosnowskyi]
MREEFEEVSEEEYSEGEVQEFDVMEADNEEDDNERNLLVEDIGMQDMGQQGQEHNVDVSKRYDRPQNSIVRPDPVGDCNGASKCGASLLANQQWDWTNLARTISSYVNDTDQISFSRIESEVAPLLFQAFSTIPYISQVSYIGRDGLLFSYYKEENQQPIVVYSNSSVNEELPAVNHNFTSYSQPANCDTGKLYGVVTLHPPSTILNPSILQGVLESTTGIASVGSSWIDNEDLLFLNTADLVNGRGAISLGFEAKAIVQSLSGRISNDGSLFLSTKDGQVLSTATIPNTQIVIVGNNSIALKLLNQNGDQVGDIASNLTCQANDAMVRPTTITSSGTKYDVYCSQVEIIGVELIFVLAMPIEGPERSLHKHFQQSYQYLLATICLVFTITVIFVAITVAALEKVTWYRCALKKQVAATAQAERKGINKSTTYATASHDVRASLAGIIGLIEICLSQVDSRSALAENLKVMHTDSHKLLGILNSILDTSKLEATLEQEKFEVSRLIEDVADLFHAAGMKKDVDIVLDLCDGSINRLDRVRGDHRKLGQILSNLVSNAVKFTSEGSVTIRAYARKPSYLSSTPDSTPKSVLSWLVSLLFPKCETNNGNIQKDENCMEFVFEVDDTGAGIPKDKQETVFENYAQIKETSVGQVGTGLGLGIVQSLVRLMGGDIKIVEKEAGKKGTCFKFNTYLTICESQRASNSRHQCEDLESNVGSYESSGESLSVQNMRLSSPHIEGSQVILFIKNEERRNVCKNFMERQGVEVLVVGNNEELASSLKRMRHGRVLSQDGSSKKPSGSHSSLDGTDLEILPTHRRTISTRGSALPPFILMVIDTSDGNFPDVIKVVADLRKIIPTGCSRVVWLNRPGYNKLQGVAKDELPVSDVIISRPFHGSRLYQVLKLLPEFGGEILEANLPASTSPPRPIASPPPTFNLPLNSSEITEVDEPLRGKKVLVVEDEPLLQRIATAILSKLGATIEISNNGHEALQSVAKAFEDQRTSGNPPSLPYDYIFMDCQMPVMDGIEATRRIREEETKYGVHMPIFAVSAHTDGPEIRQMKEAGVDYNLSKPLNVVKLVEFFTSFEI